MLKDNVDFKLDFIGTLETNSPLKDIVDEHVTAW